MIKLSLNYHYNLLKGNKTISQRQYDLLNILLENDKSISLNDLLNNAPYEILYRSVSERTVRRDINKLVKMELLNILEDGNYYLNFNIFFRH